MSESKQSVPSAAAMRAALEQYANPINWGREEMASSIRQLWLEDGDGWTLAQEALAEAEPAAPPARVGNCVHYYGPDNRYRYCPFCGQHELEDAAPPQGERLPPQTERAPHPDAEWCFWCRVGDHAAHTGNGGRCTYDNTFNTDCTCPHSHPAAPLPPAPVVSEKGE